MGLLLQTLFVYPNPAIAVTNDSYNDEGNKKSIVELNLIENQQTKSTIELSSTSNISMQAQVKKRIAVIDTGLAMNHPSLNSMNVIYSYNTINNNYNITDDHGHGTSVTGLLAANGYDGVGGIIPNAEYIIIKGLNSRGETEDYVLANSIRLAVNQGAKVILVSSGIPVNSQVLKTAVDFANGHGVIIVAAAGNNTGYVQYPAAYSSVLAVGSSAANSYKSIFSPEGYELNVMAAGEGILSLDYRGGIQIYMGTSYSAPYVAALALTLVDKYPNASAEEIIAHINYTASGANYWNQRTGWGNIDYLAALSMPLNYVSSVSRNNSMSSALLVSRDGIMAASIGAGQYKWYRVDSESAGQLLLNIKQKSMGRTNISSMDTGSKLIDTKSVVEKNETISLKINEGVNYVRLYSGIQNNITLTSDFQIGTDIWEYNNQISVAKKLTNRASLDATIHSAVDVDWFYVDIVENSYLSIVVDEVHKQMDPVLTVMFRVKETIDRAAAGGRESYYKYVTPGRYYFAVEDYGKNIINYPYKLGVEVIPYQATGIRDITNHWAKDAIQGINNLGMINTAYGYYYPNRYITRDEVTEMVVLGFKLSHPESASRPFTDVAYSSSYINILNIAKANNVISGYPNGTFQGSNNITRAELATIVFRIAKDKLVYTTNRDYSDVPRGHWAYAAINNLSRANILIGDGGRYRPNDYVTRAEAAQIIWRLIR